MPFACKGSFEAKLIQDGGDGDACDYAGEELPAVVLVVVEASQLQDGDAVVVDILAWMYCKVA